MYNELKMFLINLFQAVAIFPLNDLKDKDLNTENEDSYSLCNKIIPDAGFLKKESQ